MKKLLFSVLMLIGANCVAEITPSDLPVVVPAVITLKDVVQQHCNGNEAEQKMCAKILELFAQEEGEILPAVEEIKKTLTEEIKEEKTEDDLKEVIGDEEIADIDLTDEVLKNKTEEKTEQNNQ